MASPGRPKTFKRILLKLSGESFAPREGSLGLEPSHVQAVAREVRSLSDLGVQVAIVLGGGNILRGRDADGARLDRVTADSIGMLGTLINSLALQAALERAGVPTRVQMALEIQKLAEPYVRRRALRHMEKGRVVLFAGGTGHPYFSTDTAAALKALEIGADALVKATKVDGVYDKDPVRFKNARRFTSLSYSEVLRRKLQIMDLTAISLCMDQGMPIVVCSLEPAGNLKRLVRGAALGTWVGGS